MVLTEYNTYNTGEGGGGGENLWESVIPFLRACHTGVQISSRGGGLETLADIMLIDTAMIFLSPDLQGFPEYFRLSGNVPTSCIQELVLGLGLVLENSSDYLGMFLHHASRN